VRWEIGGRRAGGHRRVDHVELDFDAFAEASSYSEVLALARAAR
jgi:hypothetical protein